MEYKLHRFSYSKAYGAGIALTKIEPSGDSITTDCVLIWNSKDFKKEYYKLKSLLDNTSFEEVKQNAGK